MFGKRPQAMQESVDLGPQGEGVRPEELSLKRFFDGVGDGRVGEEPLIGRRRADVALDRAGPLTLFGDELAPACR